MASDITGKPVGRGKGFWTSAGVQKTQQEQINMLLQAADVFEEMIAALDERVTALEQEETPTP